ncbi:hypothetical protein [Chiayiivirga flava]|uniref:STAS/SEC14 domain-containing protein n=1 Tax=Chiayiivirga flava TaxID=659595 RepID=A0A7W8D2E2_9GAMM|nr:hypothetical protein [Chiayiivirga flava]MBB5206629.1 hypothetical protein [Chiayiivirga flava]
MPLERTVQGDGFVLRFSWHGDHLRAQVDGEHDTYEISLAYWMLVAQECARRQATRVLVVENIAQQGDDVDLPKLIDAIIALGFRDIRVAFVDLVEAHMKAMEHGEILARERHITGRVFAHEHDAVRWLRHGIE